MAAANAAVRAPKQWSLTEDETITTFESWRQNLKYVLSLDAVITVFVSKNGLRLSICVGFLSPSLCLHNVSLIYIS